MRITDLPGWVANEIGQLLASPLDDAAVEAALRAVLHLVEPQLLAKGTTPALLAKELVTRRRKV